MLLIVPGEGNGEQRVPLQGTLVVGRGARCDIRIVRPGVEDEHLRIEGDFLVAIAECVVGDVPLFRGARRLAVAGTEILLGTARLRLEDDPAPSPSVPTFQLALQAIAHARPHPRLLVVEGPGVGDEAALPPEARPATIGRSADAALVINDETVSRQHVRVTRRDGDVVVEDLGSSHGSWLGRARLVPNRIAVWPPEKMLRLGKTVVVCLVPARDVSELLPSPSSNERAKVDNGSVDATSAPSPSATLDPPATASNPHTAANAAPIVAAPSSGPVPQAARAPAHLSDVVVAITVAVLAVCGLAVIVWLIVW